jgi:hypothetical protein
VKTGFQYSPVLATPTWAHPPSVSQSARRTNSLVVVPQVWIWLTRTPAASRVSRQTTTVRVWTSMPAHRSTTSSRRFLRCILSRALHPRA